MSEACLIVSPTAGGGQAVERLPALSARFRKADLEVTSMVSTSLEHARELALAAVAAGRTAVAVGGDGLVSVVAGSVSEVGGVLGIVPAGRGNDFARALGITGVNAVDVICAGRYRAVDLGLVGDRIFTGVASFGFDSQVVATADAATLVSGRFVYPYATLKALLSWKPAEFIIELDGKTFELSGFSVAVANTGVFGGGMKIAPHASMTDGLLDVIAITGTSRTRYLRQLPKVFYGGHIRSPLVLSWRARNVRLDADRIFEVVADGEFVGPAPMDVTVLAGALKVLTQI